MDFVIGISSDSHRFFLYFRTKCCRFVCYLTVFLLPLPRKTAGSPSLPRAVPARQYPPPGGLRIHLYIKVYIKDPLKFPLPCQRTEPAPKEPPSPGGRSPCTGRPPGGRRRSRTSEDHRPDECPPWRRHGGLSPRGPRGVQCFPGGGGPSRGGMGLAAAAGAFGPGAGCGKCGFEDRGPFRPLFHFWGKAPPIFPRLPRKIFF